MVEDNEPVAKLAAKVAHELNNPLDAVLRYVSLAQRKAQSGDIAEVERHLADAQFGLQRMTEILRDLMDIGRDTHAGIAETRLPLGHLIAQAVRTIAAQAQQSGVAIDIDTAAVQEMPTYDLRISQVLANLLKNAVEASPNGSTIRLRLASLGKRLELTVEDAGPGIRPDLFPWLFTPFVTTKGQGSGHGLGLAISRELVSAVGGTLALQNGPRGGCIARVTLPLES